MSKQAQVEQVTETKPTNPTSRQQEILDGIAQLKSIYPTVSFEYDIALNPNNTQGTVLCISRLVVPPHGAFIRWAGAEGYSSLEEIIDELQDRAGLLAVRAALSGKPFDLVPPASLPALPPAETATATESEVALVPKPQTPTVQVAPAEEANAGQCSDCGRDISGYQGSGAWRTSEEVKQIAIDRFERALCAPCFIKANREQRKGKQPA